MRRHGVGSLRRLQVAANSLGGCRSAPTPSPILPRIVPAPRHLRHAVWAPPLTMSRHSLLMILTMRVHSPSRRIRQSWFDDVARLQLNEVLEFAAHLDGVEAHLAAAELGGELHEGVARVLPPELTRHIRRRR